MKDTEKQELRKRSLDELRIRLDQLKADKVKLETQMRMGGHTMTRSYPKAKVTYSFGNISNIKKTIAFVMMLIGEKSG